MAAWLATDPDPPRLQIETMLRLLYADQGSKQDLLAAVRSIRRWVLAQMPAGFAQIRGYLDPEDENATQFPGRLHIIALFPLFYVNVFEQIIIWADQAEAEITTWPGTVDLGLTPQTRAMLEDLRRGWNHSLPALRQRTPGPRSGGRRRNGRRIGGRRR